ncbi:hypothetical protein, partial [Bacillus velezensis]
GERLKEKMLRVYAAIRAAPAAPRREISALIEVSGKQASGTGQVPAFCVQAGNGAPWLLRPSARQESV